MSWSAGRRARTKPRRGPNRGVISNGGVTSVDGTFLKLTVDTLCVHGDTPGAPEIARAVRDALGKAKVKVAPFRS